MYISIWWHHLMNPHCADCKLEREESKQCSNCDTLRQLLEAERFTNKQLLDKILGVNQPITVEEVAPQSIKPRSIPWHIKREMLETDDREKARLLKSKQTTENLEAELGVVANAQAQ